MFLDAAWSYARFIQHGPGKWIIPLLFAAAVDIAEGSFIVTPSVFSCFG